MFKNGKEKYSTPVSQHVPTTGLTFGRKNDPTVDLTQDNSTGYFKGELDEFRIWNNLLSPAQITSGMRIQVPRNSANLVAAWRFDDGVGAIAVATQEDFNATLGGEISKHQPLWSKQTAPLGSSQGSLTFDGNKNVLTLPPTVLDGASNVTTTFWIQTAKTNTSWLSQLQLQAGASLSGDMVTVTDGQYADLPATVLGDWGTE